MRRKSAPSRRSRCPRLCGGWTMTSLRTRFTPRHAQSGARRRTALWAVPALVIGLIPAALVASAAPAGAAADPSQINFTLEGCRNTGGIVLPNGGGNFICPDAAYTTGNLGKGWNELDLVPHRVTLRDTSSTQNYSFIVAGDYKNG